MSLDGFGESSFTDQGVSRVVYRLGHGPAVLIMHEIPGITPQVADFARRVAAAELTAVLPVMFGTPGKALSTPYLLEQLAFVCIHKEFTTFALGRSSPITNWLRALGKQMPSDCR